MGSHHQLIEGGYLSGWGGPAVVGLPSVGHILALVALLAFWKFPRAQAFDPNRHKSPPPPPQSSLTTSTKPMLTPSTPPPPPLARRMSSEWESESASSSSGCSSDDSSTSSSEQSSVGPITPPRCEEPPEPSFFLKANAPESTSAERYRFLAARNGDETKALENLMEYLNWRRRHQTTIEQQEQRHYNLLTEDKDVDLYDWIVASQAALQVEHNGDPSLVGWKWLPRIIQCHRSPSSNGQQHEEEVVDLNGNRILHMMPALIDDKICQLSTYSLAIALYLDRKVQRDSLEKVTIMMDLRPGEGWRNISAVRLLPFIKSIVGLLLVMFPERLSKSVLYPLPFAFTWVFRAVKAVIDPNTAEKIHVLSGPAGIKSPLPLKQLTRHVSHDVALLCENERVESFTA